MVNWQQWGLLTIEDIQNACTLLATRHYAEQNDSLAFAFSEVFRPPEGTPVGPAWTLTVAGHLLDDPKYRDELTAELDRRANLQWEMMRRTLGT